MSSLPPLPVIWSLPTPPLIISLPEPPFRVSTPVPPVIEKLPESASVKSIVILVFAPERLAAPELVFLVPFVATKAVMSAALAVAPVSYTHLTLPTKA